MSSHPVSLRAWYVYLADLPLALQVFWLLPLYVLSAILNGRYYNEIALKFFTNAAKEPQGALA